MLTWTIASLVSTLPLSKVGMKRIKPNYRRRVLRLPDLDHCKTAVLNSLGRPASRRVYACAILYKISPGINQGLWPCVFRTGSWDMS